MFLVVCLEGCHGSGKTELCRHFGSLGFDVLDEGFLDTRNNAMALHPQSVVMESLWIADWMQRVLKWAAGAKQKSLNHRPRVLIADRSPYSAALYVCKHSSVIHDWTCSMLHDLRESASILVLTVHVKVDRDVLWQRIMQRLAREPSRSLFKEGDREWFNRTLNFYDLRHWTYCVTNTHETPAQVAQTLVEMLKTDYPQQF